MRLRVLCPRSDCGTCPLRRRRPRRSRDCEEMHRGILPHQGLSPIRNTTVSKSNQCVKGAQYNAYSTIFTNFDKFIWKHALTVNPWDTRHSGDVLARSAARVGECAAYKQYREWCIATPGSRPKEMLPVGRKKGAISNKLSPAIRSPYLPNSK